MLTIAPTLKVGGNNGSNQERSLFRMRGNAPLIDPLLTKRPHKLTATNNDGEPLMTLVRNQDPRTFTPEPGMRRQVLANTDQLMLIRHYFDKDRSPFMSIVRFITPALS